jgi:hypothetical protein
MEIMRKGFPDSVTGHSGLNTDRFFVFFVLFKISVKTKLVLIHMKSLSVTCFLGNWKMVGRLDHHSSGLVTLKDCLM